MIKFYDTCALLDLQQKAFDEYFTISSITLTELEQIKTSGTRDEEIKWKARQLLHLLEDNEEKYFISLYDVNLDTVLKDDYALPITNDTRIVISAWACDQEQDTLFVTADLNCKAIAKAIGLETQYCREDKYEDTYTGYIEVTLNEEELALFYEEIKPKNENYYKLLNNQYLIIRDGQKEVIDKYKWNNTDGYLEVLYTKADSKMFGKLTPRNHDIYQYLALNSLATNQITLLRGVAGTGKSYLSLGYMFSLLEKGSIDKIIIFTNTVATKGSAKLGFYPGTRTEKLLDSQIGNLLISKLGDRIAVERLIEDGHLILLPFSDLRGYDTTGMNAAVYITEAQNLDIELMRLALQRIGDDCICILDGDDKSQVDMSLYAGANNGIKRVSSVFRGSKIYGEVTLKTIYRSKIAELAQQL